MTSFNKLCMLFVCDMICKTSCLKDMNVNDVVKGNIPAYFLSRESMRTHDATRERPNIIVVTIIITSA
jgi:hypothetical protein